MIDTGPGRSNLAVWEFIAPPSARRDARSCGWAQAEWATTAAPPDSVVEVVGSLKMDGPACSLVSRTVAQQRCGLLRPGPNAFETL